MCSGYTGLQMPSVQTCLTSFFLHLYMPTTMWYVVECGMSLCPDLISCPGCVLFQLLMPLQPLHCWGGWEGEKAFSHCSSVSETSPCCPHSFQHKSKTEHHTNYFEENQVYTSQTSKVRKEGRDFPVVQPLKKFTVWFYTQWIFLFFFLVPGSFPGTVVF